MLPFRQNGPCPRKHCHSLWRAKSDYIYLANIMVYIRLNRDLNPPNSQLAGRVNWLTTYALPVWTHAELGNQQTPTSSLLYTVKIKFSPPLTKCLQCRSFALKKVLTCIQPLSLPGAIMAFRLCSSFCQVWRQFLTFNGLVYERGKEGGNPGGRPSLTVRE